MTFIKLPISITGGGSSDEISNSSGVPGATVSQALDNLQDQTAEVRYVPMPPITLTGLDITNKYIMLALIPTNPSATQLIVVGGSAAVYGQDFEIIDGNKLSWASLNGEGIFAVGDVIIVSYQ